MSALFDFGAFLSTSSHHNAMVLLFIALVGVGMGVGFSIAIDNAKGASEKDQARRLAIFSEWQMEITSKFTRASAIAGSIAAFGMVNATQPANMSAPKADRMSFVNEEAFIRLAKSLARDVPGVSSLVLAPGGVASQFYPNGSVPFGLGLYDSPSYRPMFDIVMATGLPLITGPTKLTTMDGFAIHVWHPVFVSDQPSPSTFWGCGVAMLEMHNLMHGLNISILSDRHGLAYAIWFEDASGDVLILASSNAHIDEVKRDGQRMRLPVGQGKPSYLAMHPHGGAVPSTISAGTAVAVALGTLLAAALVVACCYAGFFASFLFRHRRAPLIISAATKAPRRDAAAASASPPLLVYAAAVTLRGAQPIAEKAPLDAVVMFKVFSAHVREMARSHGCYVVSEVGDRTVYVVGKSADNVMRFAQSCVVDILMNDATQHGAAGTLARDLTFRNIVNAAANNNSNIKIRASLTTTAADATTQRSNSRVTAKQIALADIKSNRSGASKTADAVTSVQLSEAASQSSFLATTLCRVSVACHAVPTARAYDEVKDTYFYGTASVINKLCSVLDQTRMGEVAWTEGFDAHCTIVQSLHAKHRSAQHGTAEEAELTEEGEGDGEGKASSSSASIAKVNKSGSGGGDNANTITALALHTVTTEGTVLHVASWWKETGDERDNEDPSVAMAALSDAYIKRMTVIVGSSGGGQKDKDKKGPHGGKSSNNTAANKESSSSSADNKSVDATHITRTATILHIAFANAADAKASYATVRKIVLDERGAIVNAHDTFIVSAFNLLSPGGHHQLRAAEAVHRVRAAMAATQTSFVASLHHGKVHALLIDGIVMCTGDAVTMGRQLMFRAIEMAMVEGGATSSSPTTMIAPHAADTISPSDGDNAVADDDAVVAFNIDNKSGVRRTKSAMMMMPSSASPLSSPSRTATVPQSGRQLSALPPPLAQHSTTNYALFTRLAPPSLTFSAAANGLCLLYCHEELSVQFDCEPVDIVLANVTAVSTNINTNTNTNTTSNGGTTQLQAGGEGPAAAAAATSLLLATVRPRILYRLDTRRGPYNMKGGGIVGGVGGVNNNNAHDEWMYKVHENEETSPFAAVSSIFSHIILGQTEEAARLWHKLKSEMHASLSNPNNTNGGGGGESSVGDLFGGGPACASDMAMASLQRILAHRQDQSSGHTF